MTRCILDGGSQSSFISTKLVDTLKLPVVEERDAILSVFESHKAAEKRRLVSFQLQGVHTNKAVDITALESHNTYSAHPTIPQDVNSLICTQKLPLADPKDLSPDLPIELLIGGDHYWKPIKDTQPIRMSPSLVLIPSIFGWILSGNRTGVTVNQISVHKIKLQNGLSLLDDQVRNFWDLETIGINDTESRSQTMSTKDTRILEQFHDSRRIEDGRRVVSLPKRDLTVLQDNRTHAEKRFHTLHRRLCHDGEYADMYKNKMLDYIVQGQVERVHLQDQTSTTYYLPHYAVKKTKRDITKWRIVFDASSHEKGFPSLNEVLEIGPNLLPDVLSVLLRFRLGQYALQGDVSQSFLHLLLDPADRDLTRFFWYRLVSDGNGSQHFTDEVVPYHFVRLPFGLTCSPFLLSATLRELSAEHSEDSPRLLHQASLHSEKVSVVWS